MIESTCAGTGTCTWAGRCAVNDGFTGVHVYSILVFISSSMLQLHSRPSGSFSSSSEQDLSGCYIYIWT